MVDLRTGAYLHNLSGERSLPAHPKKRSAPQQLIALFTEYTRRVDYAARYRVQRTLLRAIRSGQQVHEIDDRVWFSERRSCLNFQFTFDLP